MNFEIKLWDSDLPLLQARRNVVSMMDQLQILETEDSITAETSQHFERKLRNVLINIIVPLEDALKPESDNQYH